MKHWAIFRDSKHWVEMFLRTTILELFFQRFQKKIVTPISRCASRPKRSPTEESAKGFFNISHHRTVEIKIITLLLL